MYAQKCIWERITVWEIMKNERDTNILESVYILMFKKDKEIDNENWRIKTGNFDAKPQ